MRDDGHAALAATAHDKAREEHQCRDCNYRRTDRNPGTSCHESAHECRTDSSRYRHDLNPPFPGIAESQSLPHPTLSKNVPSAATGLSGNTR